MAADIWAQSFCIYVLKMASEKVYLELIFGLMKNDDISADLSMFVVPFNRRQDSELCWHFCLDILSKVGRC